MKYFLFNLFNVVLFCVFLCAPSAYALAPISWGETPGSLSCIYGLTPYSPGCTISGATAVPNTGSGAIVIIDGQDDPNAYNELTLFHNQFFPISQQPLLQCNSLNTNQPCFQQYYVVPYTPPAPPPTPPCVPATGTASDYGISEAIDIEPEIDIEWSHAMAPNASIYMVETQGWLQTVDPNSPNTTALMNGLNCATYLLQTYNGGKGIVSYSNSNQEWADETSFDSNFQTPGIIYIASDGDYSAPARYPSTSPYVIGAGGTAIQRDASGNYVGQVWWNNGIGNDCTSVGCKTGGSGGPSYYESRPSYQNSVQKIVGAQRGVPDISFAAAGIDAFCCQIPSTTTPKYDGNNCCGGTGQPECEAVTQCTTGGTGAWRTTGGTSLAAPALAGIINSANSGATTTTAELTLIYNGAIKNYHTYWTDIISGNNGYPALQGYDFTTGLGVPRGYGGK